MAEHSPTLSDELGQFVIEGLSRGAYDLRVSNGSAEGELYGVAAGASGISILVRDERDISQAALTEPDDSAADAARR
jgi:hypothetical protein